MPRTTRSPYRDPVKLFEDTELKVNSASDNPPMTYTHLLLSRRADHQRRPKRQLNSRCLSRVASTIRPLSIQSRQHRHRHRSTHSLGSLTIRASSHEARRSAASHSSHKLHERENKLPTSPTASRYFLNGGELRPISPSPDMTHGPLPISSPPARRENQPTRTPQTRRGVTNSHRL